MANSYNINDGFSINAPYPVDARMFVGAGMKYTLPTQIPASYLYVGLKVHNIDTHITWEVESIDTRGSSVVWKNISFGVEPIIFDGSNTLLNENDTTTITGLAVGETITFSAVTFGHIKKILWTITKPGGTTITYNNDNFTYSLPTVGNYLIDLSVEDYFGNTTSASRITFNNVSLEGTIGITQFTVSPTAGLQQSTLRDYNFNILLSESLEPSEISSLVIEYGAISTTLINGGTAINGVQHDGNEIEIIGDLISNFDDKYLSSTTVFTATLTRSNGQTTTASATYTSVPLIVVNNNALVTYTTYSDETITSRVTLTQEFDENSSVVAILKEGSTIIGYLATADNMQFNLELDYELTPGTHTFVAYFTQTVGTETYSTTAVMSTTVAATTYTTTFRVRDDLSTPEPVETVKAELYYGGMLNSVEYTNASGYAVFELENGVYTIVFSKDNYATTDSYTFTVSSFAQTYNRTIVPIVSIDTAAATTPVSGETMQITYTLLPDNKYETECTVEYVIINELAVEVTTITKTKSSFPTTYNTLDVDAGWANGYTINITLTTEYNAQSNSVQMTKMVGVLPVYYGVVDKNSVVNPTILTVNEFVDTYLTDLIISESAELAVTNSTNPTIIFATSGLFTPIRGWQWAAFPSTYSQYYYYENLGDNTTNPIGNEFFTVTTLLGSNSYKLYLDKGLGSSGSNMGDNNIKFNIKLSTTAY